MKKITILLITCFCGTTAYAGWFSPSPPISYFTTTINVNAHDCSVFHIEFDQRSSYRFGATLETQIKFNSSEGQSIQWPIPFEYSFSIRDGNRIFKSLSDIRPLDHRMGLGLGTHYKAPRDFPVGKTLQLELCFQDIGPEFFRVYENQVRIFINQGPYVYFLD